MGELEDVFGDDFADEYESETQERQRKRNRVEEDTLKRICYKAVNGDGFKGSEPRFVYEGDSVPHDVLLMQAPESSMEKFKHSFDNGGMSMGMFHLDELFSCTFNEDMVQLLDRIEEGKHYIVVGRYEEKTVQKSGSEEKYLNINPVRGIVPLKVAKKYAEKYDEESQGSTIEEQREDQGTADSSSDKTEDTTPDTATDEGILEVLKYVAQEKGAVIEAVADGDEDALTKLVGVVDNNTDGEVTEQHVRDVFEAEVQEIDDEEEEEDDMGLGGLDMGDDEDEEEEEEPEPEPEPEPDTSADDSDDDEESVDDWF